MEHGVGSHICDHRDIHDWYFVQSVPCLYSYSAHTLLPLCSLSRRSSKSQEPLPPLNRPLHPTTPRRLLQLLNQICIMGRITLRRHQLALHRILFPSAHSSPYVQHKTYLPTISPLQQRVQRIRLLQFIFLVHGLMRNCLCGARCALRGGGKESSVEAPADCVLELAVWSEGVFGPARERADGVFVGYLFGSQISCVQDGVGRRTEVDIVIVGCELV